MTLFVPPPAEMTLVGPDQTREWQHPLLIDWQVEEQYGIPGHELSGMLVAPHDAFNTESKQMLVFRATARTAFITHAHRAFSGERHEVAEGDLTVMTASDFAQLTVLNAYAGRGSLRSEYTEEARMIWGSIVALGNTALFGRGDHADNMRGGLSHARFSRKHFTVDNTSDLVSVTDHSTHGVRATVSSVQ